MRKLNLNRHAAQEQRAKQQSQVQIINHAEWITRNDVAVKWFLRSFRARIVCHFKAASFLSLLILILISPDDK